MNLKTAINNQIREHINTNKKCITLFLRIYLQYMYKNPILADGYKELADLLEEQNKQFLEELNGKDNNRNQANKVFINWN